jgi:hypothetical protein
LNAHLDNVVGGRDGATKAALYADEATYKASLPVRRNGANVAMLYENPFWVHDDDLKAYTAALEKPKDGTPRLQIKYTCAPPGSGKSASVLPACLKSIESGDGFTHYLHLPFHNNGGRCFWVKGKLDKDTAFRAGGAFILDCVTMLLDNKVPSKTVGVPQRSGTVADQLRKVFRAGGAFMFDWVTTPDVTDFADDLRKVLKDRLGDNCKPLIHIDEHRYMTVRPGAKIRDLTLVDQSFRLGALNCLGALGDDIGLIATFTDRLTDLDPGLSTEACRLPVALPCIDPNAMIRDVRDLQFRCPPDSTDREEKRLWSTLLFRLMMKVQIDVELVCLHKRSSEDTLDFLQGFQAKTEAFTAATTADNSNSRVYRNERKQALLACIEFCQLTKEIEVGSRNTVNACPLLLGMKDETLSDLERQESNLVVLPNDKISASLVRLLENYDTNVPVYKNGALLFRNKAFLASGDSLSSTPLEAAYVWTLAVRLATEKTVKFCQRFDNENIVKIAAARLFRSTDPGKPDIAAIKAMHTDTLYYAAEKDGLSEHKNTHPRADIWFRTPSNQIVLIDVFGGQNATSLAEKVENLQTLINDWNTNPLFKKQEYKIDDNEMTFHGVVLAPGMPGRSTTADGQVHQVLGRDARYLLGGLDQVYRWFDSD